MTFFFFLYNSIIIQVGHTRITFKKYNFCDINLIIVNNREQRSKITRNCLNK